MRSNINKLIMRLLIPVAVLTATGCEEKRPTYDGPEFIMFSDSLYTLPIQNDKEVFDIPVVSMHTCDYDRTLAVEIIEKESNAIEGRHYELLNNTIVIKAGERVANVEVRGLYENFAPEDSLGFTLHLVCDASLQSTLYGIETKVVLRKCVPFDINNFTGWCLISRSTYFDNYLPAITQRLIKTELDPDDNDAIILKNFIYDGYDIKLKFDHENPLSPSVSCEEQVLASTAEAFGTIYGDGKLLMTSPSSYPSYYNTAENFVLLYMTLYVENVGTVGVFGNIMEWISEDEAAKLKREGY